IRALSRSTLFLLSTSGLAAGIQISQGTPMIASVSAFSPCGKSTTDLPALFNATNASTLRPSWQDTVPRLSLHATSTQPFVREESRGVFAHCPEALNRHASALQRQFD